MRIARSLFPLALLSVVGCAPSIAEMRDSTDCYVWIDSAFSKQGARVTDRAVVMSGMGTVDGAYFESETDLVFPASIGAVRGTYVKPNLQFQLGLGDVRAEIGTEDAVVERPMASPLNFGFNAVCTDRQVAMGVMTLVAING